MGKENLAVSLWIAARYAEQVSTSIGLGIAVENMPANHTTLCSRTLLERSQGGPNGLQGSGV